MALIEMDEDDTARALAIAALAISGLSLLRGLTGTTTVTTGGSAAPSGVAGGDLAGTYPNPSVVSLGGGGITSAAVIARIPTVGQKAALPGTNGAPGAGNPYVTDTDPRNTDARLPLTTDVPGVGATGGQGMAWIQSVGPPVVAYRRLWNLGSAGVSDPSVNSDDTAGYSPGSIWMNQTTGRVWFCDTNTTGSALWTLLSAGSPTPTGILAGRVLAGPATGAPALPTYRALVASDLPSSLILRAQDDGLAAPGPIAFLGVQPGDAVIDVLGWVTLSGAMISSDTTADFESTITVANQIQQTSAADLSLNTYRWLVQSRQ